MVVKWKSGSKKSFDLFTKNLSHKESEKHARAYVGINQYMVRCNLALQRESVRITGYVMAVRGTRIMCVINYEKYMHYCEAYVWNCLVYIVNSVNCTRSLIQECYCLCNCPCNMKNMLRNSMIQTDNVLGCDNAVEFACKPDANQK